MSDETASLLTEGNSGTDTATTSVETAEKPTWTEQVKGDLQNNEILGKFSTVTDAAERLIELEGNAANSIPKLGDDATDDERSAFYDALGRPDKADGYDFATPENMPDELKTPDEAMSSIKADFHAMGLTQAQGQAVMDKFNSFIMEGAENMKAASAADLKAGQEAINKAWGDDAKANLEKANRVISKFGGDDFKSFLEKSGMQNSPELFMVFHKISTVIAEDKMMDSAETGTGEKRRTASGTPLISAKGLKSLK
jgi:hypothetical protein